MTERSFPGGKPEPTRAVRPETPVREPDRVPPLPPIKEPREDKKISRRRLLKTAVGLTTVGVLGAGGVFGFKELEKAFNIGSPIPPDLTSPIPGQPEPTPVPKPENPNPYKNLKPTGEILDIANEPLKLGIIPILGQETMDNGDGGTVSFLSGIPVEISHKKLNGKDLAIMKVYFGTQRGKPVIGQFGLGADGLIGYYNMSGKVFFSVNPYGAGVEPHAGTLDAIKFSEMIAEDLKQEVHHQFVFGIAVDYKPNGQIQLKEELVKLIPYNSQLFSALQGNPTELAKNEFGWTYVAFIPKAAQD